MPIEVKIWLHRKFMPKLVILYCSSAPMLSWLLFKFGHCSIQWRQQGDRDQPLPAGHHVRQRCRLSALGETPGQRVQVCLLLFNLHFHVYFTYIRVLIQFLKPTGILSCSFLRGHGIINKFLVMWQQLQTVLQRYRLTKLNIFWFSLSTFNEFRTFSGQKRSYVEVLCGPVSSAFLRVFYKKVM